MATKTAQDVRGVTTDRKPPVVTPKVTNPARKFMSYAEAVEDNKRIKAARIAADEAYKKAMRGSDDGAERATSKPETVKKDTSNLESELSSKRKALSEAEVALKANPKDVKLKKKINKLNTEIDQLEDEIG